MNGVITSGNGTSTLNVDGGTLSVGGNSINVTNFGVGNGAGSNGAYTLGSGATLNATNEVIGGSGVGTLTQIGGTNSTTALVIAENTGANGIYALQGGTLNASSITVNSGGVLTLDNNYDGISGGTLNFKSLTLNSGGEINSGVGGVAVFEGAGSGPVSLAGGTLSAPGVSTVTQLGGVVALNSLEVSSYFPNISEATYGIYNLQGGSITSGAEGVGNTVDNLLGTALFLQNGGTNQITYSLTVSSSGNFTAPDSSPVPGGYMLLAGDLQAGTEQVWNGTFTQSGGTNTVAGVLRVGTYSYDVAAGTNSAAYNLSNGQLTAQNECVGLNAGNCNNQLHGGAVGTAMFTQTGGTNTVNNVLTVTDTGTYNLSGGILNVGSLTTGSSNNSANTGTFSQSGTGSTSVAGNTTNGGTLSILANTFTTLGTFTNSGKLTVSNSTLKIGTGMSIAPGAFVQSGGTTTLQNGVIDPATIAITGGSFGAYRDCGRKHHHHWRDAGRRRPRNRPAALRWRLRADRWHERVSDWVQREWWLPAVGARVRPGQCCIHQ